MLIDRRCVAFDLSSAQDVEGRVDLYGRRARKAGCFQNRFELARANHCVDLGDVSLDLVPVALHKTAGDDKLLRAAAVCDLVFNHLEDGVDRLLLGGVDERAGVDHEDLGVFGARRELSAAAMQQAHHDLGVDEVLGAAERDKTNLRPGGFWCFLGLVGWLNFERGRRAHKAQF